MTDLFLEEFQGKCENEAVSAGGKCTRKGLVRRVMGKSYGTIGVAHCEKCMPEFFENKHNYSVFKAIRSTIDDPFYDDYVEYYNSRFTFEARQRMTQWS